MSTSELDTRNIAISMRKSVENLVISSQDAIGQSISQALTFSGVITQQANQVIQENRSISRSPSPSLRNSDGPDVIENDKGSEMAIHVPSQSGVAGDSISLSSGSDVTVASALPKGENAKASTPVPGRNVEGRTKKKSWYTSLYPTYKSKSDDFKRLFKELPDDERLIVDYSCALQKDILAHGRLYASQNYLCFHASIFGWETSLTLRWKDVTAITKEKTALVIPNAILVCTDGEKNFLTSFSGRDKAYLMLFRIWQNALMDQPMSSQEIWQWVHSCYGEELGFNSDDEGYGRDLPSDVTSVPLDAASELDLDSSMEAGGEDSHSVSRGRDIFPPRVTNGAGRGVGGARSEGEGEGDALPTDMSDTSDSEDKPPSEAEKCTAPHTGRALLQQQLPFKVDQLFTMMFTNSSFSLELLAARGARDYVQAPWQPAGGLKCRQVSYVLGLTSGPIGPKEVHVTETQVMNKCSKPGALYSIDSSSENAGIPYADYFTVEVHYCLRRVAERATALAVYAHIKYKKSVWPMIKTFLEKNAMSGMEEYARLLEARALGEARTAAPLARGMRQLRRPAVSSQEPSVAGAVLSPLVGGRRPPPPRALSSPFLVLLLLLLLLNAALFYRLYHPPHAQLKDRMEAVSPEQLAAWSALLEKHTKAQRGELRGEMRSWKEDLDKTVALIQQSEQAIRKLLKEKIEPSLAKSKDSESFEGDPHETRDATPPDEQTRHEL